MSESGVETQAMPSSKIRVLIDQETIARRERSKMKLDKLDPTTSTPSKADGAKK